MSYYLITQPENPVALAPFGRGRRTFPPALLQDKRGFGAATDPTWWDQHGATIIVGVVTSVLAALAVYYLLPRR